MGEGREREGIPGIVEGGSEQDRNEEGERASERASEEARKRGSEEEKALDSLQALSSVASQWV